MRAVVQRVAEASVAASGETTRAIGAGLLVLLGVARGDGARDADLLADKIAHLRIFPDEAGQMNRSCAEAGGSVLVVAQFTLLGDCRRGRRPGFSEAAPPDQAEPLYRRFAERVRALGLSVEKGHFRREMDVALVNRGPVTLLLDSRKAF